MKASASRSGPVTFAAVGLSHAHIHSMCTALTEAGGKLLAVYDTDAAKRESFSRTFPAAKPVSGLDAVLHDGSIDLILTAELPNLRADLIERAMLAGKDVFSARPAALSLDALKRIRRTAESTGRFLFLYFSEPLHVECCQYAENAVHAGGLGRLLHMELLAPHKLRPDLREPWFYDRARAGGIITQLGAHAAAQFLSLAQADDAEVLFACAQNRAHPEYPAFQDFGMFLLRADNGATCYARLDWFTPGAMPVWGDGRTFLTGTRGVMELRKYTDRGTHLRKTVKTLILCG